MIVTLARPVFLLLYDPDGPDEKSGRLFCVSGFIGEHSDIKCADEGCNNWHVEGVMFADTPTCFKAEGTVILLDSLIVSCQDTLDPPTVPFDHIP